ncbi:MAG: hypothetical protein ACFNUU_02275 [Campylobacter sp.]|uniref:hypothetical protein n=1 Tax=Campylobacter sp. TaxID=205 RepID=UPI00362428F0
MDFGLNLLYEIRALNLNKSENLNLTANILCARVKIKSRCTLDFINLMPCVNLVLDRGFCADSARIYQGLKPKPRL